MAESPLERVAEWTGIRTRYLCNALRQQYGVPVCQYLPADPIDDCVVQAFFAALSPVELDAYHHAMAAEQQAARALDQARRQQLERLRYQAALAERQFNQVDPDNRLVAVELERRWEAALRALHQAETAGLQAPLAPDSAQALPPELERAFTALGQKLPELWSTPLLSQAQKKALLRCLIDKVVVHRHRRDRVHTRIVWKGGETTTVDLPIPVGSLAELGNAAALEGHILALARQGLDDATIAARLTAAGLRSPMNPAAVLPNTVRCIRLKHQADLPLDSRRNSDSSACFYLKIDDSAKSASAYAARLTAFGFSGKARPMAWRILPWSSSGRGRWAWRCPLRSVV